MKIIKFVMSKGETISLPEDKALKVIDSESQMVKITDNEGNWTGEVINKSFLVCTIFDREATREVMKELKMEKNYKEISAPREEIIPIYELLNKYKPQNI
jgi:hypothetical protein